jgi:hypothetical protein
MVVKFHGVGATPESLESWRRRDWTAPGLEVARGGFCPFLWAEDVYAGHLLVGIFGAPKIEARRLCGRRTISTELLRIQNSAGR